MAFDVVKFERGQIWVIRFKNPEQQGHEIMKDRPWVIVSNGNYNTASGMITCVPMTTRDSVVIPSQVMINNDGMNRVILGEQIRSFDTKSGAYLFDYLGNVSTEILEKLDVALSIHLGMHYSPITINNLYNTMESIVKSVSYMQEKSQAPKFTDSDIAEFTKKLKDSIIGDDSNTEQSEVVTEELPVTINKVQVTRNRWTIERRNEFLSDVSSMSIEDVMEKWNISSKLRFYQMKNYVKNLK